MLNYLLKTAVRNIYAPMFDQYTKLVTGKKFLLSFVFHNIFSDPSEINLKEIHPHEKITVHQFRHFVEYFLEGGYHFISSDELTENNINNYKNILITFDDGYFSSLRALPILNEYNIPALLFVVGNHIKENKLFWWDVLYRERSKRGTLEEEIFVEEQRLHSKRNEEIETYLIKEFGKDVFKETNDLNRTLRSSELKDLSENELITIGNHTYDHVHLRLYSDQEIKFQIENAQAIISEIIGRQPDIISYPYGDYNEDVIRISKGAGITLGITCDKKIDYLPLISNKQDSMRLGRFWFIGDSEFPVDFDRFRPEMRLFYKIRSAKRYIASRY